MKKYSKAIELLEEAMQKLQKEEFPHKGAVSLTYDTLGKVCLSQGRFQEASDMFENAVELRKEISEHGVAHIESMMHLAKAQLKLENYRLVVKLTEQVLNQAERTNNSMPTNTFISECLEVLADAYDAMGMMEKVKSTLERLQSEFMRQELVHMGACNSRRVDEITNRLNDIQVALSQYER